MSLTSRPVSAPKHPLSSSTVPLSLPTATSSTIPIAPGSVPLPDPSHPKKKHAPNLLVDIAETTESCFPYAEVAVRHGVAPARVAEALTRVVLLPLVRSAADKRRAGQLAHERVKEYREVSQLWQQHQSQGQGVGQNQGMSQNQNLAQGQGQGEEGGVKVARMVKYLEGQEGQVLDLEQTLGSEKAGLD